MASIDEEKNGFGHDRAAPEKFSQSTATETKPPKNSDDDAVDPDVKCGLGSWTPEWIQVCASPKLFLMIYATTGLIQGAAFTYFVGCVSTMEKRFAYDTKRSGLIMIAEEIAPILLGVPIGYFGGLTGANRPRIMTIGMLVGSLSCFVMAVPYFMYGSTRLDGSLRHSAGRIAEANAQFCDRDFNVIEAPCGNSSTVPAIIIFFIGVFLKGICSVMYYTIGTAYVDDSIKKKDSPVYLGILFALRLLGPAAGFLLSSLCLQFYEDPFYDPGFETKDPRWVGAWWLGFIILGVIMFIFSLPMILFPKRFPKKKIPASLQKKSAENPKSLTEQWKDMGEAMKRLGKNPILMCYYMGTVLRLNGIVGYYVLLPKYMEMQFRQSASKASLYSGPASIIGMQFGLLLGGIVIRVFRPRPRVFTGAIVITESFTVISLISCMLITCPVDQMGGRDSDKDHLFKLQNECNVDCECTTEAYTPVCGPDGKSTYFSPCFAGCSGYNKTEEKEVFTDCRCVHNEEGEFSLGDANKNYCEFECQWLITFVVILSVGKLVSATGGVGNALVNLRCVDPKDKSIALGAGSGIFSLLGFIPFPMIYGTLTDASCLVWEESCGKTGNCWVYDTNKFRYLLHGVSAAFVFAGCVSDILVWILSPRLGNLYGDDDDDAKGKAEEDIAETEVRNNGRVLGLLNAGFVDGSVHSVKEKTSSL